MKKRNVPMINLADRRIRVEQIDIESIISDEVKKEAFIKQYMPFIISIVSKTTKRYISTENDDEFSIGLIAFSEAIEKYNPQKGNFFTFAELIIRNRIIDYIRKEKNNQVIPIDKFNEVSHENIQEHYILKEEMELLKKELNVFKISFISLTEQAPKGIETRRKCIAAAKVVHLNKELLGSLYRKKKLPSTKLNRTYGYSPKFIKRHRSYIIASVIIYNSSFDRIKTYMTEMEVSQGDV